LGIGLEILEGVFDNAFNPAKALLILLSYPVNVAVVMGEYDENALGESLLGDTDLAFPGPFLLFLRPLVAGTLLPLAGLPNPDDDFGGFFKFPDFKRLHLN
jgi:hypothetical protein